MHRKPLHVIVYNQLFPNPRPTDPTSFAAHLTKNLVPEVRQETSRFYGTLDTVEARYPGLDYSFSPHRHRLRLFPHHRRLFRAFDELGLTPHEIGTLCRWEGTRWARERFEADEGIRVQDTTGDEIGPWADPTTPATSVFSDDGDDEMSDVYASDGELRSVGFELNHRLMAAVAAREGGADVGLDAEWEQWLKDAAERGLLGRDSRFLHHPVPPIRPAHPAARMPPPRSMLRPAPPIAPPAATLHRQTLDVSMASMRRPSSLRGVNVSRRTGSAI